MRILASFALAVVAAATPAMAQDEAFTGPRVGLAAGYDNVGSNWVDVHNAGVAVVGSVGYDVRRGNVVIGVDGEYTETTVQETGLFGSDQDVLSGRDLYAGARIGYVFGNNTLVYVKGGYANGTLKYKEEGESTYNYGFNGYRVGGGVERAITSKVSAKVEYRYTDYELGGVRHTGLVGLGYRF